MAKLIYFYSANYRMMTKVIIWLGLRPFFTIVFFVVASLDNRSVDVNKLTKNVFGHYISRCA